MSWILSDFDIQNRGNSAQSLSSDAEAIHLLMDLEAQFFGVVLRSAFNQLVNVD